MKSKVKFSGYSLAVTIVVFGVLISCMFFIENNKTWYIVFTTTFLLLLFSLWYSPVKIISNDNDVIIKSVLKSHKIKMIDIERVELFQPTMGSFRICGSGGFMGYWGIFREGDIGRYAAYYGKASDCFLIRMKNGDKYVLGCENPLEMVNFINSRITSSVISKTSKDS